MALVPYFERDGITLYHGDCREVLPQLASTSIDLVITDPPYLVSYSGRWGSGLQPIQGDGDPSWVLPVYSELFRVLKPDSLCLSFYGWPHAEVFLGAWRIVGFRAVSVFVFVKTRIGFGYFSRAMHEQAYLLAKGFPEKPESAPCDVLDWDASCPRFHPHQKPAGAIAGLIEAFSNETYTVLDPFAGSGTTLVAARLCGRRAIGIEIEERFCEAAAIRLSQQILPFREVEKDQPKQEEL